MLSPGTFHKQVPKDLKQNLEFRRHVLSAAKGNSALQKGLIAACREDILFWINTFGIQFNPKKQPKERVGPFITWDCQERALMDRPETTGRKGILWCIEHDKGLVVEKSREMGISWLFLFLEDWLCLFHPYTQCLSISRSSDAVDCKSPDSLFWKIRFIHQHLPDWLKGPIVEEKMYFGYKRSNSVATGEASTGRAGVGGRASIIFIDEFSQIKEAIEVRQRTASTSDCRFFNGTHLGADTEFYRLTQAPEINKIVVHWTEHPEKRMGLYKFNRQTQQVDILDKGYVFPENYKFIMDGSPTGGPYPGLRSPWYDQKVVDIGSTRAAAMELDIDPQGAASQFFDALKIADIKHRFARTPLWEGDLDYDRDLAKPRGLIERRGGLIKLWIVPDHEGRPPRARYGMACDVAAGSGATPSCVSVGNADTGEKVLEYANALIDPKDLAVFGVALAWLFKDENGMGALFGWEIPGPGIALGDKVIELGYRNVYFRETEHALNTKTSLQPGWVSNVGSNRTLLENYRYALYRWEILNQSEEALEQCLAFEYDSQGMVQHGNIASPNDPSGARYNHGDLVIADALMYKMLQKLGLRSKDKAVDPMPEGSLAWRRELRRQREQEEMAWQ